MVKLSEVYPLLSKSHTIEVLEEYNNEILFDSTKEYMKDHKENFANISDREVSLIECYNNDEFTIYLKNQYVN